ncbi:alpha-L-fucosidase [Motilibacter rhizosphaerae]|uniref:alpha-L-fucosidase n=1 Tax=Motilibacter rhizosphaerae TaxID=598652 RepID=UPI00102B8505|nr:alpha-L-fucosidase [Motilibacter rhizosphaerae]
MDDAVDWTDLTRPTPAWFPAARLGIFVHWGAYSVPAWAEPTGELGTIDEATWVRHNPYAEWYWHTIQLPGAPAREHHRTVWGDRPYDDFLDLWKAESFDAAAWARLFRQAGARYVVLVTKHHDGIALWDAPGTGTRNTVHRGPQRDLVAELAAAVRAEGLRFGTYYSGGLDWSVTGFLDPEQPLLRPNDAAYAAYAAVHVRDLVDRYAPDVLWNDIEWPDAGKHRGRLGLHELFRHYYDAVAEGVVNDRWGETHWDYRTSEYQHARENESAAVWENNRGIGLSFGYNQVEGPEHSLDAHAAVRHLVDVVSRGGNLLLDVGPTAAGEIPELQRRTLEGLGAWLAANGGAVHGAAPLSPAVATASDEPWVRWTATPTTAYAVVDAAGDVTVRADHDAVDWAASRTPAGTAVEAQPVDGGLALRLPPADGPAVVGFPLAGTVGPRA